jgi:transcription antitermination factor NusG
MTRVSSPEIAPVPWYALRVRSRGEELASIALRHRGYDPYYPARIERKRYCDRVKTVARAVMPGYLFCRFVLSKKVPVISAPGIDYILESSGIPAPIPDEDIENLRRAVEAGACATQYLRTGQKVVVKAGALKGVRGILARDADSEHLVVSVDLLGRSVSVQIDRDDVDLATD